MTRHDVSTAPDGSIWCSCSLRLGAGAWTPSNAKLVSYAHLANPDLPVTTLLAFVAGRPIAELHVGEQMVAVRDLVSLAKRGGEALADLADEHNSGLIALAMDLQDAAERLAP